MKTFNTAGPCDPELHYMLPPLERMPAAITSLIETRSYFVLHAPRQTGKTTLIRELARKLTAEGRYAAVQVSMQPGAGAVDNALDAQRSLLESWRESSEEQLPDELRPPPWPEASTSYVMGAALAAWARACPRPLVLFLKKSMRWRAAFSTASFTSSGRASCAAPSAFLGRSGLRAYTGTTLACECAGRDHGRGPGSRSGDVPLRGACRSGAQAAD